MKGFEADVFHLQRFVEVNTLKVRNEMPTLITKKSEALIDYLLFSTY